MAHLPFWDRVCRKEGFMQEVFEKIIEKLQESGDAANDKIMEQDNEKDMAYYDGYDDACEKAVEIVKQAATEYNENKILEWMDERKRECEAIVSELKKICDNGWIPCSERMPENRVLGCDKYGNVEPVLYIHGKRKFVIMPNATVEMYVIAWQPLPEPYEPKGE